MKKLHLFKRTLLLLALIVGCVSYGWATENSWTHEFVSPEAVSANSITVNGVTWNISTVVGAGSPSIDKGNSYSKYCLKFGTGAKNCYSSFTFSTDYFKNYKVKSVKIQVLHNASKSGTLTATQGDVNIGTSTQTIGSSWTDVTVNTVAGTGGTLSFTYSPTECAANIHSITVIYDDAPAYEINAQSNNNTYGTVSLTGTTITATPASGYRVSTSTPYTVNPANSATVSQNGNAFTVTPSANTTVTINFEAIPTYTVSFNAEGGTCGGTTSATEAIGGAGVTLPTATTGVAGWEFAGWAADAVDNTTTQPTLYKAGSTYYPTGATTLHAVYTLKETTSTFVRVTSVNQVEFAKSLVVVKNSDNYVLNHSRTAGVAAPEESAGEITAPANTIFALTGDNSDGFVLTGENGTLSQTTVSTSDSNDRVTDWSGYNNQWKIEANAYATNTFALSNSTNVALEYYSGWKTEYNTSYNNRQYTAMKLYVPKSAYDSNPSALTAPTVEFDSTDPVTLYLDGTTTNTNTATVTGVSKTINYTSSNTGVATVNSEGVVTAVGIGTTTITASVDAELGVSAPASDTYEVTVKSATTLAGIKAQATSSTAVDFTADLASDLVITYVNGSHAYLQSGDVAVYASCATGDWEAGKKFTGAITGQIKRLNNEYQITSIDQTPVAGGVVPDAIEVAITDLTTANYATYEGRKIAINGATVNTKMTDTDLTGGKITTDGTNTLNIYAREKGITLTKDEKGNFVGYIGRYNDGIRYYMYEQSQFTKTHNAPQNQVMSFTKSSYSLDEETDAVTGFVGQEVTKTTVKGAVTYAITGDAIGTVNAETGVVTLNGDCGTATIVATAAAYDEYDEGTGHYTPYKELTIEYSVTVRPRYMVTFSVNGVETVLRQATSSADIAVPTPSDFGDYKFMGWSESTVAPTDVEPSMTDLGATVIPTDNDDKYYAVFAIAEAGGEDNVTSTFTIQRSSALSSPYENNNVSWSHSKVKFDTSNSCGMPSGASITITLPENYVSTKSITLTGAGATWAGSTKAYVNLKAGETQLNKFDKDNLSYDFESNYRTFTLSSDGTNGCWIAQINVVYTVDGITYSDYRTSLPNVEVTISESKFLSFCYGSKLDFSETDVKAYKASVDGEGKVTLNKVDIVPAEEGVILYCETPGTYAVPVTTEAASDVTGNQMKGVLERTQVVWNPTTGIYNYILQQGQFNKANDGYLKANRAYLQTSYNVDAEARALEIVFDDEIVTGINATLKNNERMNHEVYNLNGQRVATPVKGNIYIVNGKKVMFK